MQSLLVAVLTLIDLHQHLVNNVSLNLQRLMSPSLNLRQSEEKSPRPRVWHSAAHPAAYEQASPY